MSINVQKYGGSSLENSKLINHVAERVCSTQGRGNQVVAVVSAMGDTTDQLLELAKVSLVGTGMPGAPGYVATMFRTLYEVGINIDMITTSEIRTTCITAKESVPAAVKALHASFRLDEPQQ